MWTHCTILCTGEFFLRSIYHMYFKVHLEMVVSMRRKARKIFLGGTLKRNNFVLIITTHKAIQPIRYMHMHQSDYPF